MLNSETSPPQIILRLCSAQVSKWLTKQQALAFHFILIVIEADHIMIHAAAKGDWLTVLDWAASKLLLQKQRILFSRMNLAGLTMLFLS